VGATTDGTRRGRGRTSVRDRHAAPQPLVETKLSFPRLRKEHLERRSLLELLEDLSHRKLTVVAAPTGYGKTTVLAGWAHTARQRVAWVTLDAGDNDPARLLGYVITALGRSAPAIGRGALRALASDADPLRSSVPRLLNDVGRLDDPVVLVLDDYHAIEEQRCHDAVGLILDQAPDQLRIVLSTRADPPLPVGRLRARGELGEIRASRLRFSRREAEQLLNESLALALDTKSVERLEQRTEGWPAGLYLAGLSLQGREEPRAFVDAFAGSNRHVVDYLGTEVLAAHPDGLRAFLIRTSILSSLSAPLCDAVLEDTGSGIRLAELGRSNLFLLPLDGKGEWYRCHRIFRELLRFELGQESPEAVPVLHARAAAWYEAAGHVGEAVEHALLTGDAQLGADVLARAWRPLYQFGQLATLHRLLSELPRDVVDRSAPLGFIAAMLDGGTGAPEAIFEERLARVEESGWDGPFPDTTPSLEVAVAFARAVFVYGDVRRSLTAAELVIQAAGDDFILGPAARIARGRALYLLGDLDAAREAFPSFDRETAHERPTMSVFAPALRSLIELEDGKPELALALASAAVELAEELGLSELPLLSIAHTALGSAFAARGELSEAGSLLERGAELSSRPANGLMRVHAMLALAPVQAARGDRTAARHLLVESRAIIDTARDPGVLGARLEELERRLSTRTRREISPDDLPTESELRVLRMLASGLTQREIGRELFLSANTVKSHTRALYRKLRSGSRDEAVARARSLGII
jgi:ATP/maltotriose-dependent transcriptional regulator MalT